MRKSKRETLAMYNDIEIYKMVLSGKLKTFPKGFWHESCAEKHAMNCLRYLLEEILQYDTEDLKFKLNTKIIRDNKLGYIFKLPKFNSIYSILNEIYPGRVLPWEMKSTPKNFWTKETAKEATNWFIKDYMKWSVEDVKNNLNSKVITDSCLSGVFTLFYDQSCYKLINDVYPDEILPWELQSTPKNFWTKETAKQSILWLIEEKNQWNKYEVAKNFNSSTLIDFKLIGMLTVIYNGSVLNALNDIYPNTYYRTYNGIAVI